MFYLKGAAIKKETQYTFFYHSSQSLIKNVIMCIYIKHLLRRCIKHCSYW